MSTKTKKQDVSSESAVLQQVGASETPEQRVERLKRELTEARGQAKKTKVPAVRCAHEGCKLYAMQGREDGMCSNHRPAMEHLTEAERVALVALVEESDSLAVVELMVEQAGWAKVKAVAQGLLVG